MATFNKFESFVGSLGTEGQQLNTDTINIYLTNAAPSASADNVKADLAEITNENGYTGPVDTANAYSEASGTGSLTGTDVVITASGGTVGPFRYPVLHNSTNDQLIGWWDYGSSITLQDGESFTVDFGATIATIT